MGSALYSSPSVNVRIRNEEDEMKSILMIVSGVLCVAGGLLHGSGFPVIHGEVAKANVTGDLANVVDLAWVFMSLGVSDIRRNSDYLWAPDEKKELWGKDVCRVGSRVSDPLQHGGY